MARVGGMNESESVSFTLFGGVPPSNPETSNDILPGRTILFSREKVL